MDKTNIKLASLATATALSTFAGSALASSRPEPPAMVMAGRTVAPGGYRSYCARTDDCGSVVMIADISASAGSTNSPAAPPPARTSARSNPWALAFAIARAERDVSTAAIAATRTSYTHAPGRKTWQLAQPRVRLGDSTDYAPFRPAPLTLPGSEVTETPPTPALAGPREGNEPPIIQARVIEPFSGLPLVPRLLPEGDASLARPEQSQASQSPPLSEQVAVVRPPATSAPAQEPSPVKVKLDRTMQAVLQRVNASVNGAIRPMSDLARFNVEDVWGAQRGADGVIYGDCEDYVLMKRQRLIREGLPPAALSIAVARTRRGAIHAVLIVETDRGEYVLDNLNYWVTPWNVLPYRWIMRQNNGAADDWRAIAAPVNAS